MTMTFAEMSAIGDDIRALEASTRQLLEVAASKVSASTLSNLTEALAQLTHARTYLNEGVNITPGATK